MTGVDEAVRQLRVRLFHNHSRLAAVAGRTAECHREWDALQVEREAILADFLELGVTLEEVLWDVS